MFLALSVSVTVFNPSSVFWAPLKTLMPEAEAAILKPATTVEAMMFFPVIALSRKDLLVRED
ncbi:hypothetical protein PFL603g_05501 [Pseudomonas fluorescens]|uniref:Uncharacterized protein n=1 Tax=Pseudomonas fluorescens TaxID=294 RepID=A0A109KJQ6_PSEFL|nr:hypothetical protein PFL603g_05166 [Pseudomonas fluorescens]KWV70823.1 hypothetical protein PFL603g_05501 [Pseudomonas fluorescens]